MTYLGSWKIDDTLAFTVNTHSPTTGAETDADSEPTYRVYENEVNTPILTGSMAKLDDANTVGYYSKQITLSAANGLEKGKSYNIRITATVGGVTGTTERFFQIEAEVDANVVSSDSPGVTTLLSRITVAPPTAIQIRQEIDSNSSDLDTLIANLSIVAGYIDTEIAALATTLGGVDTKASAIKNVTDILNGLLENVSGYRYTAKALEEGPGGGGTTYLYGTDGPIDWTYTVYKPGGSEPLPNCSVFLSADAEGEERSETLRSDSLGRVRGFQLYPGTVYVWRSHPSYTFDNPDIETVSDP